MKVFLSWSGDESKAVARALREWLPDVIQNLKPWMSQKDLEAGVRWSVEIEGELKASRFGIICVTPANRAAPWLNFEAGAISNSLEGSRVVPYIHGMGFADIEGPLTQFQGKEANRAGTHDLVQALNGAAGDQGLEAGRLEAAFTRLWPELEAKLAAIQAAPQQEGTLPVAPRTTDDKLDELLVLMRQTRSQGTTVVGKLPREIDDVLYHQLKVLEKFADKIQSLANSQHIAVDDVMTVEMDGQVWLIFVSPVEISEPNRRVIKGMCSQHGLPLTVNVDFHTRL